MFTSERPHYSLALFSSFIYTCTTSAKKQFAFKWTLDYFPKKSPKNANVADMVKKMSVASIFFHVGRTNKSLCNTLCAFMFSLCNICFHSPYFHWDGDPSILPESNRRSFWIQISFLTKVVHVHMKLENNASLFVLQRTSSPSFYLIILKMVEVSLLITRQFFFSRARVMKVDNFISPRWLCFTIGC